MGLVKYEEVYNKRENVTQFPIVVDTQVLAVQVKSPAGFPSNRFYLGSNEAFKYSWLKAMVAEDVMPSTAAYVDGNKILGLVFMEQMYITLINYNNDVVVDHLPLSALAPVDSTDTQNVNNGAYFRTHLQFDPEASYVSWADYSRSFSGTRILILTCYLQSKLKK